MKRAITRRAARAAAAVLFAAAALVLAACSGPPAPSSGSSSPGGVVTINWQTTWSGQALQVVNQLASQFNTTHPDIHVVTSNIPSATGDEKLLSEIAAGDAPDVSYPVEPGHRRVGVDRRDRGEPAGFRTGVRVALPATGTARSVPDAVSACCPSATRLP